MYDHGVLVPVGVGKWFYSFALGLYVVGLVADQF